jgi:hypothetical protein
LCACVCVCVCGGPRRAGSGPESLCRARPRPAGLLCRQPPRSARSASAYTWGGPAGPRAAHSVACARRADRRSCSPWSTKTAQARTNARALLAVVAAAAPAPPSARPPRPVRAAAALPPRCVLCAVAPSVPCSAIHSASWPA